MELIKAAKCNAPMSEICKHVIYYLMNTDAEGRTALMYSIFNKNSETANILISECGKFDKYGKNAYIYAHENGMPDVIKQIEEDYADVELHVKMPGTNQTVWQYCKQTFQEKVQEEIIQNFNIEQSNQQTIKLIDNFGSQQINLNQFNTNDNVFNLNLMDDTQIMQPPGLTSDIQPQPYSFPLNSTITPQQQQLVLDKSYLSSQQFSNYIQLQYFFQALIQGFDEQQLKTKIKQLLDKDLILLLCKEYNIAQEQLAILIGLQK